jgi:Integrase core domain
VQFVPLRLGIAIERIKPGNAQQNGRHERMHLTLKTEATKLPGNNFPQQQARFDHFIHDFNVSYMTGIDPVEIGSGGPPRNFRRYYKHRDSKGNPGPPSKGGVSPPADLGPSGLRDRLLAQLDALADGKKTNAARSALSGYIGFTR